MLVYHYTSLNGWDRVRASGFLRGGPSHAHPRKPNLGGPVVHVTTNISGHNLGIAAPEWMKDLADYGRVDRSRVRITINVRKPSCIRYVDFCRKHNSPPDWIPYLENSLGYPVGQWRIIRGDVPAEMWIHVMDMRTGSPLNMARQVGRDRPVPVQGGTS
jgi:hypothetical protein